jgi:hypothetical protein
MPGGASQNVNPNVSPENVIVPTEIVSLLVREKPCKCGGRRWAVYLKPNILVGRYCLGCGRLSLRLGATKQLFFEMLCWGAEEVRKNELGHVPDEDYRAMLKAKKLHGYGVVMRVLSVAVERDFKNLFQRYHRELWNLAQRQKSLFEKLPRIPICPDWWYVPPKESFDRIGSYLSNFYRYIGSIRRTALHEFVKRKNEVLTDCPKVEKPKPEPAPVPVAVPTMFCMKHPGITLMAGECSVCSSEASWEQEKFIKKLSTTMADTMADRWLWRNWHFDSLAEKIAEELKKRFK